MWAQDLYIYRKAVRTKDGRLPPRAGARRLSHIRMPPHPWTAPHLRTPPYSDTSPRMEDVKVYRRERKKQNPWMPH